MSTYDNFCQTADTVTVSASTTSANVALGATRSASGFSVMCTNAGSNLAFIAFGTSTVAATTAGIPVMPGAQIVVEAPAQATYVAAITGSSTTTMYFTPGQGA